MSRLDPLQQNRPPDQLAAEIEPLAQSLAYLADDTRAALREQQSLQQQQQSDWEHTSKAVKHSAEQLLSQLPPLQRALRQHTLKTILLGLGSGVLAAVVTSVLCHWLPQYSQSSQRHQALGAQLEARWQQLNATERTQLETLMGWQ